MKTAIRILCSLFLLLFLTGPVQADLITIGLAGYDANGKNGIEADEHYKLIWDNDDHLVWLDYSSEPVFWSNGGHQLNWAASLGSALDIRLFDGYTLTWTEDAWHLPDTEKSGPDDKGGFELTTSDLGHLFYVELGNLPIYYEHTWGNPEVGLANTGPFENLLKAGYFENDYETDPSDGTPDWMWSFLMTGGSENVTIFYNYSYYGIAVRHADVVSTVPVPGTLLLLGWGLAGLAGLGRRKEQA